MGEILVRAPEKEDIFLEINQGESIQNKWSLGALGSLGHCEYIQANCAVNVLN